MAFPNNCDVTTARIRRNAYATVRHGRCCIRLWYDTFISAPSRRSTKQHQHPSIRDSGNKQYRTGAYQASVTVARPPPPLMPYWLSPKQPRACAGSLALRGLPRQAGQAACSLVCSTTSKAAHLLLSSSVLSPKRDALPISDSGIGMISPVVASRAQGKFAVPFLLVSGVVSSVAGTEIADGNGLPPLIGVLVEFVAPLELSLSFCLSCEAALGFLLLLAASYCFAPRLV